MAYAADHLTAWYPQRGGVEGKLVTARNAGDWAKAAVNG